MKVSQLANQGPGRNTLEAKFAMDMHVLRRPLLQMRVVSCSLKRQCPASLGTSLPLNDSQQLGSEPEPSHGNRLEGCKTGGCCSQPWARGGGWTGGAVGLGHWRSGAPAPRWPGQAHTARHATPCASSS